jgi:hypothetical protein
MSGKWRKNEKDTRATPLDGNAIKLQSLANLALTVDRDCRAVLARINWTKRTAAGRARDLLGHKFSEYLEHIVNFANEIGAEPERVFRNIIAWSPEHTVGILLGVARWDMRQKELALKGLNRNSISKLKGVFFDPYLFVGKRGSVEPAQLESMIPHHPTVILKAYFHYYDGPARAKQKSLVKEIFKAAGRLDWRRSKNTALGVISDLFRQHNVTAQFSALMFFSLSHKFKEEVLENARLYKSIIPATEIPKIRSEVKRRQEDAEARYKQSSRYLASVVQQGDFRNQIVIDLVKKAKSSEFHQQALLRGLISIDRVKLNVTNEYKLEIRDLPNSEVFITLKLLILKINIYFDSINAAEENVASKAFENLSVGTKTQILREFNLKKIGKKVDLSVLGAEFIKLTVHNQLASSDKVTADRGVANTLLCTKRYQLGVRQSIQVILKQKNGVIALLDGAKDLKGLYETFDDDIKNLIIQKTKAFRLRNFHTWQYTYARKIVQYFPDLIFKVKEGPLGNEEILALILLGDIERVINEIGIEGIIQSQAWQEALAHWNARSRKIPASVIDLARVGGKIASDLVRCAAGGLERRHFKKIPLEILVKHLANGAEYCSKVGEAISDRKLIAMVPWAQKQWKDKPAYSAAIELGLAFGFKHATFLTLVSKRIRPPFNRDLGGALFDDLYRTYEIPKKAGGKRKISEPNFALKSFQKTILDKGIKKVKIHAAATGFVTGKNIIDNARPHTNKDLVVNADIRGFFPQTKFKFIRRAVDLIKPKTLSVNARWMLAELLSYGGGLPAGAPSSPGIANIIMHPVDLSLSKACKNKKVDYTRYADDLTFSGVDARSILPFARDVISSLGYEFDKKKTNIFRKGRRQLVTGLVVNKKPNMAKPLRKRLRAAVHARINNKSIHWGGEVMSDEELLGRIAFLFQTQPQEAIRLRTRLKGVIGAN